MGKASKGTQSSSESTQQLVQISTVDNTKQVLLFLKLPFGLAISPNELRILKAIYYSMVTRQSKISKLIQNKSHTTQQKILYIYVWIYYNKL